MSACLRRSMPIAPEDGSQASAKVMHQPLDKIRLRRTHQLPVGSPCPCSNSTRPSWPRTNPPANLRIHPRSCRDLPGAVVRSADRRYDDGCSTTSAWLRPKSGTLPPRNCKDQQALVQLWAARVGVAWVAAWVAVWETEWAGLSAWSPAKL